MTEPETDPGYGLVLSAVSRHLTTANTHRILRGQAFDAWKTAVAVAA